MNASLSALVALLLVAGAAADPVEGEPCPGVCPFIFAPVCGAKWFDRFQTFPNDCVRRSRNCRTRETFEFVCNGTCLFEHGKAEQKQCAPLRPGDLCVPFKG
ncbi:vasotab-like [Thrips palmi]|uniref:Vasotab-like n=1 Tax=Thrips palmi TaxID=161013 RepID=A0A6P8XYW1_THRPL|nr:vasotab-like [Thrips palmi]